ncbi:alpha/beta fold hydrolase [Anaeromyxobacter dehalogenans]|uniref:Alpha/beta hydrolase fold-1 n=1 Tax=Anaeromyxobacter dehalogenans (strain 2CP-C) TaxID=290397 RepID=Q2IE85_ANADE|nr:alpha/beta fold hydrolase [Anaeromyxobacter dehalogenans]ABC82894.1 Alpha/beta hydrolase fold-1 [Anaeromyxobacter dehalogenans 2CP-C]
MDRVISRDGTPIAFERHGAGPALIVVDGALCSRTFGPVPQLAPLLARRFTVIAYDRRGRGGSGDTAPYAVAREVEDLAALVEAAGGAAAALGFSSGAALALEAAAGGVGLTEVAAYEPPWVDDETGAHGRAGHDAQLRRLLAGAMVRYFMRRMVGVPAMAVWVMRLLPMWRKLEAVAHTLPYDAAIMGDWAVPAARLSALRVPVLLMNGGRTAPALARAARAAAAAIPGARHLELPGQAHAVEPGLLAETLEAAAFGRQAAGRPGEPEADLWAAGPA